MFGDCEEPQARVSLPRARSQGGEPELPMAARVQASSAELRRRRFGRGWATIVRSRRSGRARIRVLRR